MCQKSFTFRTNENIAVEYRAWITSLNTYRKYISELLAISSPVSWARNVELSFDCESTHLDPHSGRQCAHGNCDENEAKK